MESTKSPRVEACIADCMARFSGESERASLRYFEAVHQELAPLARELEAEFAKVKDYATTLATSMHRQHYSETAPNWQPLDDVLGLLTQIDNMYAGLRNDLATAEAENKRLVGMPLAALKAERDALLLIKEAADVLYSEAEEFDLPDGLGMGASQQYWDDLANALFPDDGGKVIQADLRKAQAEIDSAIKAFETEIAKPDVLPCGHPTSMLLKSAETGDPLYCEYCDCIQRRNDAEKMERDLKLEIYNLKADKSQTLMEAERAMAQIREVNLKMWAERDALRKAWECAKRQNAHDMLLSGDEIHQHDAAIYAARKEQP